MKKMVLLVSTAVMAFFLGASAPSFAQAPPPAAKAHHMMMKGGHHWGGPFARLHLSEAQRKQLHDIFSQLHAAMLPLRFKEKEAQLHLGELFLSPSPDKGAVEAQVQAIAALKTQAAEAKADSFFSVWSILTPQQQPIFASMVAERILNGGGHHGFHGRHGFGGHGGCGFHGGWHGHGGPGHGPGK